VRAPQDADPLSVPATFVPGTHAHRTARRTGERERNKTGRRHDLGSPPVHRKLQADGVATSCAAGQPALSLSGCGRITGRGQRSLPPSQAQLRLWCGCRGAGRPRGKRKPGAGRGERSILPLGRRQRPAQRDVPAAAAGAVAPLFRFVCRCRIGRSIRPCRTGPPASRWLRVPGHCGTHCASMLLLGRR